MLVAYLLTRATGRTLCGAIKIGFGDLGLSKLEPLLLMVEDKWLKINGQIQMVDKWVKWLKGSE